MKVSTIFILAIYAALAFYMTYTRSGPGEASIRPGQNPAQQVSDVAPLPAPTLTAMATVAPEPTPKESTQVDSAPPAGMVVYAVSPTRAVEVPHRFAVESVPVVQCESRFDPAAVGDHGRAYGLFQVRLDVHAKRMLAMGLEPSEEADRVRYAVILWEETGGWSHWSCQPYNSVTDLSRMEVIADMTTPRREEETEAPAPAETPAEQTPDEKEGDEAEGEGEKEPA